MKIKTMLVIVVLGFSVLGGWAYAGQLELMNHLQDALQFQKMDDGDCPPSTDPNGQ